MLPDKCAMQVQLELVEAPQVICPSCEHLHSDIIDLNYKTLYDMPVVMEDAILIGHLVHHVLLCSEVRSIAV